MTISASYQLLLLFSIVLSSFDQVHCDDNSLARNHSGDDFAVSTTLAPRHYDNDKSYVEDSPPATPAQNHENLCIHYDDDLTPEGHQKQFAKRTFKKADDVSSNTVTTSSPFCKYCFTFWVSDPRNKSRVTVSKQGCWNGQYCQKDQCVSNSPPGLNNSHFCCCSGHMCNAKFKDIYNPAEHTTTTTHAVPIAVGPLHDNSYKNKTIVIALVSVFAVALATVLFYLAYRLCRTPKPTSPQSSVARVEADQEPMLPAFNVDDLKIEDVIVRGRYSEVRKGLLGDREVAVKIYQPHHRQYYYNEGNAFTQPFMDHENVVKFCGAKEQQDPETNLMQYIVVTEYFPLGSLTGYLKHNTVDWYTLCQMCQGISRGLAHLHTDIQKGALFKPAMAHRDLNTRNILVNSNLTCVLADLGFSVAMIGSKIIKNGVAENAEQASLADVGTLRYMAPEVFDGAVNLRDCEASLKQIDIYALGLVMWEIASRCVDLYQGAPVPEYQLPFQAEAGTHPTFEQMQILIVKYKTRPKFPEVWKDANPAVRSLKETIEDCWDTDAEARLTSLCVQERITDMTSLWVQGAKHRGVTPTLNATMNLPESNSHGGIGSGNVIVSNGVTYLPSYVDRIDTNEGEAGNGRRETEISPSFMTSSMRQHVDNQAPVAAMASAGVTAPLISNVSHLASSGSGDISDGRIRSWLQDQSMSGSTVDTLLPPTPSVEDDSVVHDPSHPPIKANNVMLAKNKAVILHPNQGRNPTVERNTHKRSDEELTVSGNQLVGPGDQPINGENNSNKRRGSLGTQSAPPNRSGDSGTIDGMEAIESSSLVQNDALNQHHIHARNTPIPYLQNHVHGEVGGTMPPNLARPKLANVSSNRNSYLRFQGEDGNQLPHTAPIRAGDEADIKSFKQKLSKLIRPKDLGLKFSQMVLGLKNKKNQNSHSHTNSFDAEAATGQGMDSHRNVGQYINSGLEASPVYRNPIPNNPSSMGPLNLEVQVVNGSVVTRTCNDSSNLNPSAMSNVNTVMAPQARVSATNVMRLGILASDYQEEMPSCSLFTKNGAISNTSNLNCVSANIDQEHTVPLQTLAPSKWAKDYGSMQPVMINQAYGLDLSDEILINNLHHPQATVSGVQNPSHFPENVTNFRPAVVSSSNVDMDQRSSALLHNCRSISSLSQSSSNSGYAVNTNQNFGASLTYSKPPQNISGDKDTGTSSHSPQNMAIAPVNRDVPSTSHTGPQPKVFVKNLSEDIPPVQVSNVNALKDFHDYIPDTKGGNSIMHTIHMDENCLSKDGLPSSCSSRHSSKQTRRSASQLPAIRSQPQMSKESSRAFNQNDEDSTVLRGAMAASTSKCVKSSSGLCQSQSATDLEWHPYGSEGNVDEFTDSQEYGKDSVWQNGDMSKSFSLSGKHRPQSLSLKGHNYNRSRGRSASSSSSLPHPAQSKISKTGNKTTKVPAKETVNLDENGPFTLIVPNVTLDKSSPLFQTVDSSSKMPSLVVPSVAVSTVRCGNIGSGGGNSTVNASDGISSTDVSSSKTNVPLTGINIANPEHSLFNHVTNDKTCASNETTLKNTTDSNKYLAPGQSTDSSEKIRRRIKTPVSFKKGRLSLYDDRLMTQSLGFVPVSAEADGQDKPGAGQEDSNNNSSTSNDNEINITNMDYHKMIKSDSDLVV